MPGIHTNPTNANSSNYTTYTKPKVRPNFSKSTQPTKSFEELFKVQPTKTCNTRGSTVRRKNLNNVSYQVYSLNNFNDLCGAVQTNQYAEKTRFRFLVDQTGKLWFAPEGIANNIIPAHYQITGQDRTYAKCYAAGTISVEDGVLTSIDNKSGDFTPAFENLFYLLAILANTDSLPFKISENLKIEENRGDHRTLVISSNDLMSWGKQYAHTITEQPQENITRVYGVQPGNDADKDVLRQYCPSPAKKRCHNEITRPSSVDRSLFFPPSDNKASSSHENEPNDNLAKVLF